MQDIMMRAGCFVSAIVMGYVLKKIKALPENTFPVLTKLVVMITAPCAIIHSFIGTEFDSSMLFLIPMGLLFGFVFMLGAYLIHYREDREWKAFSILNMSAFNIGSFTLPFAQGFLGPVGVITTSLFDIGNACISLGGAYGIAAVVKEGSGFSLKRILKLLVKSVPFVCYVIILTVTLLDIPIPRFVSDFTELAGRGNGFLAMFMIGVGFELKADKTMMYKIIKLLVSRYVIAITLALGCYTMLPFEAAVRQALVILCLSPIPSIAPAFTGELDGDIGLSSAINSFAIVISIVLIISALTVML